MKTLDSVQKTYYTPKVEKGEDKLILKEWIMAIVVLAYLTVMIGVKWMIAVSDRKTYNRYYAVRHAGSILNFVGLNILAVGYDNKS